MVLARVGHFRSCWWSIIGLYRSYSELMYGPAVTNRNRLSNLERFNVTKAGSDLGITVMYELRHMMLQLTQLY